MVDCWDDIESDMSVLHRIDDMWSLPAARFFKLAWRLSAYPGVLHSRSVQAAPAAEEAQERSPAARAQPQQPPLERMPRPEPPRGVVTAATLPADPLMRRIFSFG
jgi:hypothetical protein